MSAVSRLKTSGFVGYRDSQWVRCIEESIICVSGKRHDAEAQKIAGKDIDSCIEEFKKYKLPNHRTGYKKYIEESV